MSSNRWSIINLKKQANRSLSNSHQMISFQHRLMRPQRSRCKSMLISKQKCYNKHIIKFRFNKQDGENMTQLSKYEAMIVKSGSKLTKQRKQILNISSNIQMNTFCRNVI